MASPPPIPYPTRRLGRHGPAVSAIGLGAGSISGSFYGPADADTVFQMLTTAADTGVTFWDTSDFYDKSEAILGDWFVKTGRRSEIFLATKFGLAVSREEGAAPVAKLCSEPAHIRGSVAKSLETLKTDYIDLYYQHKVDPDTPIEVVLSTLLPFLESGVIKYLALSDCSPATLRRAKDYGGLASERLVAIQREYSPFETVIERNGVLDAAKELGVAVVAYSPLGKGMLTGRCVSPADLTPADARRNMPRFSAENFAHNITLLPVFEDIAAKHGVTSGQVALAWILAQGDYFIPIPGTTNPARLLSNSAAAHLVLSPDEVKRIRTHVEESGVHGERSVFLSPGDCVGLDEWESVKEGSS
ncbi:NADP-dependent oxidoreductase domain-containing protein [Roridomyces roridus]|uniref:NADP-dependent oxidoreductase domain-containing protein n=1 Tax=Roridomyces roridus TaxID=1738132 RepID=A0AAD7BLX7_9AGAR|nr:NADP-dependent oxidoreductase domain-containing protein [Roridomyces roridus]